jgi:outer membrane receptor protein involved in Fe transport
MHSSSKLSYAIAAILGGGAFGPAVSANSTDTSAASDQIQEITVTAQRRTENVQNVPIAIQALTGETLKQLNLSTFEDLIKYLPNVTAPTVGPGQTEIFMRGLSAGSNRTQSGGSITGSRSSRGLREPCSEPVLRPASFATSPTSRRST